MGCIPCMSCYLVDKMRGSHLDPDFADKQKYVHRGWEGFGGENINVFHGHNLKSMPPVKALTVKRSMPEGSSLGTKFSSWMGLNRGKSGRYSGSLDTPGQVSSVGVPRILKILSSWSLTELPGKSGRPDAISMVCSQVWRRVRICLTNVDTRPSIRTCKNTSCRPDVNRGRVLLGPHQDIWSSVPQCYNLHMFDIQGGI